MSPKHFTSNKRRMVYYKNSLSRFSKRYDALTKKGYDVKVMSSTEYSERSKQFWRFTKYFEKMRQDSLLRINVDDRYDRYTVAWPQDIFQVYGNVVAFVYGYEKKAREIMSKLEISNMKFVESTLGEGGYVVRDKNIMFVSDAAAFNENDFPDYCIYKLPTPNKHDHTSILGKRMSVNQHIDTEFNFLFSPGGNSIICVNEAYYNRFRDELDDIKKKVDARMHIIPERSPDRKRYAVNFIRLLNGEAMMPDNCPYTQGFLEACLGKNNVLIAEVGKDDYSGEGGGLKCGSNFIVYN